MSLLSHLVFIEDEFGITDNALRLWLNWMMRVKQAKWMECDY